MYVGRLAPSPTGRVHLGIAQTSLVAWLDARHARGRLLLRVEDIDGPRTVAGSAEAIVRDFEWLGLDWDGPITYQSHNDDRYEAALDHLRRAGRTFWCTCSRKDIREASAPHQGSALYPGTCRDGFELRHGQRPALRLRTKPTDVITHTDRLLPPITQNVDTDVGDFVLQRADGLWAYQLSVTVDDLEQGVTCIVRGADLYDSTPRQLLLRNLLTEHPPRLDTLHVPLVLGPDQERLAKRHGAKPIDAYGVTPNEMVGRLAHGLGLVPKPAPISTANLLKIFDPKKLSSTSSTHHVDDD